MKMFPVQHQQIEIDLDLQQAAYEVYVECYAPQPSLLEPSQCRGGFSTVELVVYLYVRQFPRDEWPQRADEAFAGKVKRRRD